MASPPRARTTRASISCDSRMCVSTISASALTGTRYCGSARNRRAVAAKLGGANRKKWQVVEPLWCGSRHSGWGEERCVNLNVVCVTGWRSKID